MFTTISKAGIGLYTVVVVNLLRLVGVEIEEGTLTEAIYYVLNAFGAILFVIGQVSRKDLSWGIFRKQGGN